MRIDCTCCVRSVLLSDRLVTRCELSALIVVPVFLIAEGTINRCNVLLVRIRSAVRRFARTRGQTCLVRGLPAWSVYHPGRVVVFDQAFLSAHNRKTPGTFDSF